MKIVSKNEIKYKLVFSMHICSFLRVSLSACILYLAFISYIIYIVGTLRYI